MGNCLVTKLKSVVQNDNLLKADELRFRANNVGGSVAGGIGASWTKRGYSVTYLDGTAVPEPLPLDGKIISVNGKYNLNEIKYDNVNILLLGSPEEAFVYSDALTTLRCYFEQNVNLESFAKKTARNTLTYVMINNCIGDIANMNIFPNLRTLNFRGFNPGLSGNIIDLANLTSLTTCSWTADSQVGGDLDAFATAQVAAGRTSGTLRFNINNRAIAYNDQHPEAVTIQYDSSLTGGYSITVIQ